MENANKHLQRAVAALVVVIIALVIVVMRLAVGGHTAVPQETKLETKQEAAQEATAASLSPASPRPTSAAPPKPAPKPTAHSLPKPVLIASTAPPDFTLAPRYTAALLTDADLADKTGPELRLMRNEVYARHGYLFHAADLLAYFRAKPWYQPDTRNMRAVEGRLSSVDTANLASLTRYEEQHRRLVRLVEAKMKREGQGAAASPVSSPPALLPPALESPVSAPASAPPPPAPSPVTAEASGIRVWVDTHSGIYHFPGQRWYGRTKEGEFMSESAAQAAGYRATRNGQ